MVLYFYAKNKYTIKTDFEKKTKDLFLGGKDGRKGDDFIGTSTKAGIHISMVPFDHSIHIFQLYLFIKYLCEVTE